MGNFSPSLVGIRRKDIPNGQLHAAWKHEAYRASLLPHLRALRPICVDEVTSRRMLYQNLEVAPLSTAPTCRICARKVRELAPAPAMVEYV